MLGLKRFVSIYFILVFASKAQALTTGTSPSINAVLATITYNTAFSSAPVVVITPANAATASQAASQAVWVNITTTGFTINTNATAVVSSTAYKWNFVVIQ